MNKKRVIIGEIVAVIILIALIFVFTKDSMQVMYTDYQVEQGDTVDSIALYECNYRDHRDASDIIRKDNNLVNAIIKEGDILRIPVKIDK